MHKGVPSKRIRGLDAFAALLKIRAAISHCVLSGLGKRRNLQQIHQAALKPLPKI
jgi:hypothetical protein